MRAEAAFPGIVYSRCNPSPGISPTNGCVPGPYGNQASWYLLVDGTHELVYTGGSLWTLGGESGTTLFGIDISTGAATDYPVQTEGEGLVAGTGLPNTLFTYDRCDSPLDMNAIDVSSTPAVEASGFFASPDIENVEDIAISPDGTHFVPAGGYPYDFTEFNTSNFLPTGTVYPGNPYPSAVAMTSANGGLFAGGLNGAGNDLVVYPLDNPSDLVLSYQFPTTNGETNNDETDPRGIAFGPDGTLLFVVSDDAFGVGPEFHVFNIGDLVNPPTQAPEASITFLFPILAMGMLGVFVSVQRNRKSRQFDIDTRQEDII